MVIGRFAPSPTGPLHLGSLVAAVASYCDAKSRGGKWLLRIEDVDQTRTVTGASENIMASLTAHGFVWEDEILYQSQRTVLYQQALDDLLQQQLVYPCTCSRKEIADSSPLQGIEGVIYPGTCRHQPSHPNKTPAWRIKVSDQVLSFVDRQFGWMQQALAQDIGDFILKRADGLFAYQLAVVVDDAEQGITDVVRGADLLHSTARQIFLQQALGFNTPRYLHLPVVTNGAGEKLSKQTLAPAIQNTQAAENLYQALCFLTDFFSAPPPASLRHSDLTQIWQWAMAHWQID